ncbi:MAG: HAMP domain-containing histidine kinase [Bryobacterales bacterium]|nr:HAMP domain-containing histidine kinase [Bryobacterales bacterium]
MALGRLRDCLRPDEAEQDEAFRQQIKEFSCAGLGVLGGTEVLIPGLWVLAAWLAGSPAPAGRLWQAALVSAVGLATFSAGLLPWVKRRPRAAAVVSAWLVAVALIAFPLENYLAGEIALLMLVTVAAIPLRPLQTLSLGLAITVPSLVFVGAQPSLALFLLLVTAASTGLTSVMYCQRRAQYRSQASAALYERAASLSKLAAAVSHELGSPIGVLTSSIDTLLVLAARQATAPAEEQAKLVALQADLRRTVSQSAKRLQTIVTRVQGLTNLEDAEIATANLNDLLRDALAQYEPELQGKVTVSLDLQPLPPLACRARQLSAVFSTLLSNAIKAVNGGGRIVISTRDQGSQVEVAVSDNGRGVPAAELETIFDPGFMEKSGRISTRNWSLFSARQIVLEHGGEIRIGSREGKGTSVRITLPYRASVE